LVHDYAVSGWLVSPIPEIYVDARLKHDRQHRNTAERLFIRMFRHEAGGSEEKLAKMIDTFWTEYKAFISKSGVFAGRDYIW